MNFIIQIYNLFIACPENLYVNKQQKISGGYSNSLVDNKLTTPTKKRKVTKNKHRKLTEDVGDVWFFVKVSRSCSTCGNQF